MKRHLIFYGVFFVLLAGWCYHCRRPVPLACNHAQAAQPALADVIAARNAEIVELRGAIDYLRRECLLLRVQQCESGFRHDGLYGAAGEYGQWQFMRSTFEDFKKASGHNEWNWYNRDHQEACARWAFENGYAGRWTCFGIVCDENPELCSGIR